MAISTTSTDDTMGNMRENVNTNANEMGDLANLTTTAKDTLVSATNELDADVIALNSKSVALAMALGV